MCPNMRPRSQSISVRFVSRSLSFTVAHASRIRMHWQIAYTHMHPSHLICINWYNPYRSIAFGLLFARLCLRCIGMLACDSQWHDTRLTCVRWFVRVPSDETILSLSFHVHRLIEYYYYYATDCHNVNPFRNATLTQKRCDAIQRNIELWPAQQCSAHTFIFVAIKIEIHSSFNWLIEFGFCFSISSFRLWHSLVAFECQMN